jgi:hypothetical protein
MNKTATTALVIIAVCMILQTILVGLPLVMQQPVTAHGYVDEYIDAPVRPLEYKSVPFHEEAPKSHLEEQQSFRLREAPAPAPAFFEL